MRKLGVVWVVAALGLGCGSSAPRTASPPLPPGVPLPRALTATALVGDGATGSCTVEFTGATPAVSCDQEALECHMLIESALDPGPPLEVVYGCGARCADENVHEVVVVQTVAGLLLAVVDDAGRDQSCGARATVERNALVLVGGGEDGVYEVVFPWDAATHRFAARREHFTPSTH